MDTARGSLLNGFVRGLERDTMAVVAAIATPWSTSPVEGQITRLKAIKRSMYGRAGFPSATSARPHGRMTGNEPHKARESPESAAGFVGIRIQFPPELVHRVQFRSLIGQPKKPDIERRGRTGDRHRGLRALAGPGRAQWRKQPQQRPIAAQQHVAGCANQRAGAGLDPLFLGQMRRPSNIDVSEAASSDNPLRADGDAACGR